jgi:hypothetical protein
LLIILILNLAKDRFLSASTPLVSTGLTWCDNAVRRRRRPGSPLTCQAWNWRETWWPAVRA